MISYQGVFDERTFSYVPGSEIPGIIEIVGAEVTDLVVLAEVYCYHYPGVGYAEHPSAPKGATARKPISLLSEEAAGAPAAVGFSRFADNM